MKRFRIMVAVCLMCGTVSGADTLREFSWSELKRQGRLGAGEVVPRDKQNGFESLLIENHGHSPLTVEILSIDNPGIAAPVWALKGRIRYESLEGVGYVEMWSHFPDGSRYFSRTLAAEGPMASLHGSSDWRDMALPFSAAGTEKRPSRLVVNILLPGNGKVWLGPLVLKQYGEGENPLAASGAWWTDTQGGMIGGIGGSVLGLTGGVIGLFCSLGRARSLALGLMAAMVAVGLASAVAGLVAFFDGQPYGVYYPLLLGGGLSIMLFGGLMPVVRRRYADAELRRMRAMDIA